MANHATQPSQPGDSGWVQRPPLNHARPGLDVATPDGTILAIGGFIQGNGIAFVEARQAAGAGTWHDLAPLPAARSNAQVAALGKRVYVAGGAGPPELDRVDVFDLDTGSWTSAAKLPQTRSAGAAAALNGRIYVAGGAVDGGSSPSGSVIRYDPGADSWTDVAPMHQPRDFLRMVAVQGHLYAIGGFDGSKTVPTVERYDPTSDTWTTVAPMHQDRGGFGAVVTSNGRCIVVVGGSHSNGGPNRLRSTEVYSVAGDQWQTLSVLLQHARTSLVSALEANGAVLAIGGEVANHQSSALVEALTLPAGIC